MQNQRKYLRPNRFGKVLNAIAIRLGFATSLTIRGRTSGQPREVAVTPIELDGHRYLVGARGETEWVRNLRAAGEGELRKGGKTERFRAIELTGEEQASIARPTVISSARRFPVISRSSRTRLITPYFESNRYNSRHAAGCSPVPFRNLAH